MNGGLYSHLFWQSTPEIARRKGAYKQKSTSRTRILQPDYTESNQPMRIYLEYGRTAEDTNFKHIVYCFDQDLNWVT